MGIKSAVKYLAPTSKEDLIQRVKIAKVVLPVVAVFQPELLPVAAAVQAIPTEKGKTVSSKEMAEVAKSIAVLQTGAKVISGKGVTADKPSVLEKQSLAPSKAQKKAGLTVIETVKIILVNGKKVRDDLDMNFCLAGHHYANPQMRKYIGEDEIWIDSSTRKTELPCIFAHEFHERTRMKDKMPYPAAHEESNVIEMQCREAMKTKKGEVEP